MTRRMFLGLAASSAALAQTKSKPESFTASATRDRTPRVGVVSSAYAGGTDHFGNPEKGLADPRPIDAELTRDQVAAMLGLAIEFGSRRGHGLEAIEADAWVTVLLGQRASTAPGSGPDDELVAALIDYLVEHRRGGRITIAQRGVQLNDQLCAGLPNRHFGVPIECVDLARQELVLMPLLGRSVAQGRPERSYPVAAAIQQCDRLISVSPMKTDPATTVSLSVGAYDAISPPDAHPEAPHARLADLYSLRPADYAIVGGGWGRDAGGEVRHNVVVAGTDATGVDAVAAEIMGFNAAKIAYLAHLEWLGLGFPQTDAIWTRGQDVADVRRGLRRHEKTQSGGTR